MLITNPQAAQAVAPALGRSDAALHLINAAEYGAKCHGDGDDTRALQAALNAAYAYNLPIANKVNVTVELPQGTCMITAPLLMGLYGSLVGAGYNSSLLVANYGSWKKPADYTAVELTYNQATPGGASQGSRRIGGFSLVGIGNANIAGATGILVTNTSNQYDPNAHAFNNLSIDHMQIADFDVAINAQDMVNSQISFVNVNGARVGLLFDGCVENVFIEHSTIENGSWRYTATHTPTIGLDIVPNPKYSAPGYHAPQGIFLHDSTILAFDYDIQQLQCVQCEYHHNTIDEAGLGPAGSGDAIYLGQNAIAGGTWINDNYIGLLNPKTGTAIYSAANTAGRGTDGLWIQNNEFLLDNAQQPVDIQGIVLAGTSGGSLSSAHIDGNVFWAFKEAIVLNQNLIRSTIKDNSGSGILTDLVNLSGTPNLVHAQTIVDGNTVTNAIPAVKQGSATGYLLRFNSSANQLTGTFTASGPGCSFAPGVNACSATIKNQFPFPDTNYMVTGCAITGASTHNYISSVAPISLGNQFVVAETGSDAASTGGGTIRCTVVHQ